MLIGVLGGGQLGRMLALAGVPLGLRFRFLDPSPVAPASHIGEHIIGDFDDAPSLDRFARGLDVVTYEFENVPVEAPRRLAAKVPVYPPLAALETGQDRLLEKQSFRACGMDVHDFAPASSAAELAQAVEKLGLPLVAKTRRMGYDGKGQMVLRTPEQASACWAALGGVPLLVERFVAFERELSIVACRGRDGAFASYPLVENTHREGILRTTRAPARGVSPDLQAKAERHARAVMESLGYVGVLAIELFEQNGRLLTNEMAPRVHNTGHWTIEGAATSQFENHCRAVAGLPLGDCRALGPSMMINLIGALPKPEDVLRHAGAHLHLYGKEPRPGRKVGHITVTGADVHTVDALAAQLATLPGA